MNERKILPNRTTRLNAYTTCITRVSMSKQIRIARVGQRREGERVDTLRTNDVTINYTV